MPKRERTIAILASVAVGLFLFVLYYSYQQEAARAAAAGELVTVYEAAGTIAAYTPITAEMVREVKIPRRYARAGLITEKTAALGHVSLVTVPTGNLLTSSHLLKPDTQARDEVKITLTQGVLAEAGLIPGDQVVVYASFRSGESDVSQMILQGARVASVTTRDRETAIALMVPVHKAEELIRLHDFGRALHITRRPLSGR